MEDFLNRNWLKLVAIVLLLGALYSFPYAYYQLMEWIVVGASIMTAYQAYKQKKLAITWLFALVAVIFNPLAPIYLGNKIWPIADVVAAVLFFASFFVLRGKKK